MRIFIFSCEDAALQVLMSSVCHQVEILRFSKVVKDSPMFPKVLQGFL